MKDALDFSGARPDPGDLANRGLDALFYVGTSRPTQAYVDSLTAAGVRYTFIFETDPNRSQQGYQAGVYDAQFFDQRANERGYPPSLPAMVVASDGSSGDPNPRNSNPTVIGDYGEAWARTTARPLCAYGNRYTTDAFNAGVGRVDQSRLVRPGGGWLPIPWGGTPDRDVMGQDANTPSPIGGTDLNRVWVDYFATPAPPPDPPPPPKKGHPDMDLYIGPRQGEIGNVATLMQGSLVAGEWSGNQVDVFGMSWPQACVDWWTGQQKGDAPQLHYLPDVLFNAEIMSRIRWPGSNHIAGKPGEM